MFKVNDRNTIEITTRCEICLKLTMETPEQRLVISKGTHGFVQKMAFFINLCQSVDYHTAWLRENFRILFSFWYILMNFCF